MHIITRNVNSAFRTLVEVFHHAETRSPYTSCEIANQSVKVMKKQSRNGDVLMIEEPVTVTYTHPRERVLFNQARDCSPFLHLFEALWMLAGRNDVASLAYYAKQMNEYSDDGKTLNGAYGYRWRNAGASKERDCIGRWDQLGILVNHLKADPTSRRAVLQMWDVENDLLKIGGNCPTCRGSGKHPMAPHDVCPECEGTLKSPLTGSKDVCCNLCVMFSLRDGRYNGNPTPKEFYPNYKYLDMTVTNRSNDMIWGMLGTNYTTFSFLQEYMAARLGIEVGKYHHFTSNLHIYMNNWKPELWLKDPLSWNTWYEDQGTNKPRQFIPLVKDPAVFEEEVVDFVECNVQAYVKDQVWEEPFLRDVAKHMCFAFHNHKRRDYQTALIHCSHIQADDWRIAATNWIKKRQANYERGMTDDWKGARDE